MQSIHIAGYLRLNEAGGSGAGHDAIGVRGAGENYLSVNPASSGYTSYFSICGVTFTPTTIDTNGRFIASNISPNAFILRNGVTIASTAFNTSIGTNSVQLSAFASIDGGTVDSFSPQELGFISVGKGLTTTQAAILDTAMSTLFAAISR
jgi:hypothetical protein